MKETGTLLGAALGFILGNDILPRYLSEPNSSLQDGEGAFMINLSVKLGIPIALGLLGYALGEKTRRFFKRIHLFQIHQ